jgi:hypothetical protein
MELSSSWEATNCTATQELPSTLWNPKAYYLVHRSPPLVPILNQISPVHITPSYLSKIHFNIIYPPTSWSSAFPPISYMHSSLPYSCYMPCPSHPPWLDHFDYTWRRVQIMKLLSMLFSPIFRHLISLRSKYSLQHPVLSPVKKVNLSL